MTINDFVKRDIDHLTDRIRELEDRPPTPDIEKRLKVLKRKLSDKQLKHKPKWQD